MTIQRSRFPRPIPQRTRIQPRLETIDFFPIDGMNASTPPELLRRSEAADIKNLQLAPGSNALTSRPGVRPIIEADSIRSSAGTTTEFSLRGIITTSLTTDGSGTASNRNAESVLVISDRTVFGARPGISSSYRKTDVLNAITENTGTENHRVRARRFLDHTHFTTASGLSRVVVFTSQEVRPQWVEHIHDAASAFNQSGITLSQDSFAKYVTAFNERLLFFNSFSSVDEQHPTRVHWSVKGDHDFTSVGAGFQDLAEMSGEGAGIVRDRNRLILFSDSEIWEGLARNDAYAFDFRVINPTSGTWFTRTITETSSGIMFLGKDLDVKLIAGNEVISIGKQIQAQLERIYDTEGITDFDPPNFAADFWAKFNPLDRTFQLYFPTNESNPPTQCFVLDIDSLKPSRRWPGSLEGFWSRREFSDNVQNFVAGDGRFMIVGPNADLALAASAADAYREDGAFYRDEIVNTDNTRTVRSIDWHIHTGYINNVRDGRDYKQLNEVAVKVRDDSNDTTSVHTYNAFTLNHPYSATTLSETSLGITHLGMTGLDGNIYMRETWKAFYLTPAWDPNIAIGFSESPSGQSTKPYIYRIHARTQKWTGRS